MADEHVYRVIVNRAKPSYYQARRQTKTGTARMVAGMVKDFLQHKRNIAYYKAHHPDLYSSESETDRIQILRAPVGGWDDVTDEMLEKYGG